MDVVTTRFIVLKAPLSDSSRIQHLYEDTSDDIPIFGSSKALGHYCPDDMGIAAFNYGMNGASFEALDVFLQIELAKTRTTPVVVELQFFDTGNLGYEGKFIPFVSDPRFRHLLEHFHAMKWQYYLPGIRYFGNYDVAIQNYVLTLMHVFKVRDGYSELVHVPPFNKAELDELVRKRLLEDYGYFQDEDQKSRLISHITRHPQRLFILTIAPYHPCNFVHFKNGDQLEAFKARLSALPNVVLLDYSHTEYPEDYWLDTIHLRRPAAAIYSKAVGEKIREILRQRGIPFNGEKSHAK